MQRLEFHISYSCRNRCLFCSERDQLERFSGRFISLDCIKEQIGRYSQRGYTHITFTGGEPSLHPQFFDIVNSAKEEGFKTYVTTNGGLFASGAFCRKTLPWLDEICFSIHGHNAYLHNFHTRNRQSFGRLLRALKNVEDSGREIFGLANVVVTKHNFYSLPEIINFIGRYDKIKHVLISNFAPEGDGLRNFRALAVNIAEMKEEVGLLAALAKDRSLIIRFFGLPLCVLKGYEGLSNDLHWSGRTTIEQDERHKPGVLKKTLSFKPVRGRTKTPRCIGCAKNNICAGIFRTYYHEFGDAELSPF